ncbi:MAG TPA: nitroreductase family deazaflavin-dependent oxidoreductase [Anaerolineae bacterium]|nr:nitroreductase family deazaflavin-dependent oxidoreductase [Anaerolineae bacterium]
MAKNYQLTPITRLGNVVIGALLRAGLPLGSMALLSVRGRKSGKMHTTPVNLVEQNGTRWLVAPYGVVNWVHNIRAAGEAQLTQGRRTQTVTVAEVGPAEAAPILKAYLQKVPLVRSYFDVTPDASLAEFEREVPCHPVFRIIGARAG